ncbi:hypothetical protein ACOMHN_044240 [Nucella lapillus]
MSVAPPGRTAAGVQHLTVCDHVTGPPLSCPPGHALHVLDTRCAAGDRGNRRPCGPAVRDTLIRLCEGRSSCAGLGLSRVFGTLCHRRSSPADPSPRLVVSLECRRHGE